MSAGFVSEKTAEIVVFNSISKLLESSCSFIHPISYRTKRSNTIISKEMKLDGLQLFSIFVRRPKIDVPNDRYIDFTLRPTMYYQIEFLSGYGIPSYAVIPFANNIEEMGFGTKIKWFDVGMPNSDEYRYEYLVECLDGEIARGPSFISSMSEEKLCDSIFSLPSMTWYEVIDKIERWESEFCEAYFSSRRHGIFKSIQAQRPLFIVVKKKVKTCNVIFKSMFIDK